MHRYLMICAVSLMGCEPKTEFVPIEREVPAELLAPVPVSQRQAKTYRDLAVLATEHRAGLKQANAQIEAIGRILGPQ